MVLRDSLGETYEYRGSEVFIVESNANWVVDPVCNHDLLTLQTCTYPTFWDRLIVRADRR